MAKAPSGSTPNPPPRPNTTQPGRITTPAQQPPKLTSQQLFSADVLNKGSPAIVRVAALFQQLGWKPFPRGKGIQVTVGSSSVYIPGEEIGTVRFFNSETGFVTQIGEYSIKSWHCLTGSPGHGQLLATSTILEAVQHSIESGSLTPLQKALGRR